ncbi:LOW QUALITY PROTEIN: zinc finger protein 592 [Colossoma macropomum]|uniref:LOW QUALITY PROTEIN: zinc finger protein 592 n=1 Tax=Colossoma macropomum TaxID=42526 RepID=UPI001864C7B0|nr:LOW QUALITY PROTEIN: zinc finger protein 592 [Colossoma macropomum]
MGDMKTPDFDDLLAAFDIPDATSLDAKEAIQESQDEAEGHLKHSELCMDATVSVPHPATTLDAPAVSVIVKNTNRQDSYEPLMEKDSSQLGHLLQNGFRSSSSSLETHLVGHSDYTMLDTSPLNGDCSSSFLEKIPLTYRTEKVPPLSESVQDFSPVSSPDSEEIQSNTINNHPHHGDSYFPNDSLFVSAESSISDNHGKSQAYSMIDKCHRTDPGSKIVNSPSGDTIFDRDGSSECKEDQVEKRCDPVTMDDCIDDAGTSAYPTPETNPSSPRTFVKTQTSKLSSCLDALVALNAKNEPSEQTSPRDLPVIRKEMTKVSPKVPISPRSPRSPLEVVKRLIKQPDSPMSVCSDSSGKASPALVGGSPPAIPRVRIKTIKTSSGQIKRTVTSIFPDSETEDLQSPFGSSPSQSSVEDAFSKTLAVCHSHDIISEDIFENGKQESSKIPLSGHSSASIEALKSSKKSQSPNSNCGLKRTLKANKQRKLCPSQAGYSTNPNYLPKALHLANLNLVPHSVAASVTARSSTHRQDHSQLSSSTVCSSVPLVHQVQKTLANTHAIIPNTAAGTLNRLLNYSNPVPTYVPNLSPPPDSNIRLPAHGYCCLECGDSFGLEKSLAFHYSRRSVHIEVTCVHCSKTLVFFNRCALLAHARDHKNKGMMMQCSQLFMKPIAVDQMLMPSKPDQSASQTTQGRSTVHLTNNQAAMPLYPDKDVRYGLKCLECNKQMSDYVALAGHYQRSSTETEGLMCKVCTMLLPNKCSYRAHQRIHAHKSPFCCPECGALSRSVDFQKHVKGNCLHYARKVGYSCLHCETLFMSLPLLKSHIEEKHCEVFYKCTVCPVAFKTSDGCLMHVKSKHSGSEPSYQLIHKCSCETVFKKKQLLYQHLHQRTCIFRCPECTSFFMQKLALVQHVKGVHGDVFRGETEICPKLEAESASHNLNSVSSNRQTKLTKPSNGAVKEVRDCSTSQKSSNVKNSGWTCGECLLWVPDRETYVSHMKTSHGKSVKRNPCRLCERSFNSSTSLRRHIRNDHDRKKKVYTCWYCTNERMTCTQLSMLKNHLSLMHGIKNPDFSLMAKLASQETSKHMRLGPKRAAPKDSKDAGDSGTSHSTPAKRLKPLFRCAKCGLTTEDPVQFQEHIPQHKTDADTPQCQHCGLCFTSQLALSRHLYIVHKVKELEGQEDNKEDLSDLEGTGMQAVGEPLTNQQSKKSQHRLLSPGKTVLCTSELQTETGSQTLALESLESDCHSSGKVQTSGTNGSSVEEEE